MRVSGDHGVSRFRILTPSNAQSGFGTQRLDRLILLSMHGSDPELVPLHSAPHQSFSQLVEGAGLM